MYKKAFFSLILIVSLVACVSKPTASVAVKKNQKQAVEEHVIEGFFTKEVWFTKHKKALAFAKKQNKPLLILFTGTQWCPPCIYMEKNVFDKPEFREEIIKLAVLLKLDTPSHYKKSLNEKEATLKQEFKLFAKRYRVASTPTVVIVDSSGKELNRFVATRYASVKSFLAEVKKSVR